MNSNRYSQGRPMLRYKLKERIADKEFRERRRITVQEVAESTGFGKRELYEAALTERSTG